MPRILLPLLFAVCLALIGGSLSADYALRHFSGFHALTLGVWQAEADFSEADAYARAQAGRSGSISLGAAEGIRFRARSDASGRALSGRCRYILAGQVPEARFFTLYPIDGNKGGEPIKSGRGLPDKLFSQDIIRMESGAFRIILSPRPEEGNWLAVPEGDYALQLNLYDTPITARTGTQQPSMPQLTRLKGGGCG